MEPNPYEMTDAEWRAYRAGRKERQRAMDNMDGAIPNEPPSEEPPVSSDLLFALGPEGLPYFPGMGDAFFNPEGDLTGVPLKPMTKREEIAALNMMTAAARGVVAEGMPKNGEDMVALPHHYARFKIEPIRFICENKLDWFQGNIVKYSLRWDAKNGVQDIDKVVRYAQMYRLFILGDPDWWKAGKPEDFKP